MRREWELDLKTVKFYPAGGGRVTWYLEGELGIDLILANYGHESIQEPFFEMARDIKYPDHVESMVEPPFMRKYALEDIAKDGYHLDVFWQGFSPEELEEFCKASLLPIPQGYKQFWEMTCSK